jgi:bifunctional non-homologous end joining protein LigD
MKPMLPSLTFDAPDAKGWFYEVKYDGFRAILEWDDKGLSLTSRNGKPLLELFPEVRSFLEDNLQLFEPFLPLQLDGELVYLENKHKAHFGSIQVRGRMRSEKRILEKARQSPCRLLIFDALKLNGKSIAALDYRERKAALENFFTSAHLPLEPDEKSTRLLQMIPGYGDFKNLWEQVILHDGEGIVAKQEKSKWEEGKRSTLWQKYKNWKYVSCFITAYEKSNGYFYAGVYDGGRVHPIGQFIFGLKPDEKKALMETIKNNKREEDGRFVYVNPGICTELKYLEIYDGQMREPHFHQFRFDLKPEQCTYSQFAEQQKNLPDDVEITHPDKPIWETPALKKIDFIHYLREISPYMLPFLKDRLLTVIRYPHGIFGEPFYQKNAPDYTPDFVETKMSDGINYIVCNNLKTFLWLGNQLAFEFHIPFQTIKSKGPSEIVFDLDPPSRDAFTLAIKAALMIKEVLDHLKLTSFVKTSGNKGLQVYIPLPENAYTYDDTRLFTSFIADYLISKEPDLFTTERMKKNRGGRLYVDYIQHAEGKTIVAPYSARGNQYAGIAAPLFWEEVNDRLRMEEFRVDNVVKRINKLGDPLQGYFSAKDLQAFSPVLEFLNAEKKT